MAQNLEFPLRTSALKSTVELSNQLFGRGAILGAGMTQHVAGKFNASGNKSEWWPPSTMGHLDHANCKASNRIQDFLPS
eukprot:5698785-Amphidinium_carterae.1